MRHFTDAQWVRSLLLMFLLGGLLEVFMASTAEARAGGRRSMGQKSKPQPTQPYYANKQEAPAPKSGGGSMMKGLAAGVAGGFLGSMLFSSLGHAAGAEGAGMGGIGLLEIILLAGAGYLIFRWWKKKQLQTAYAAPSPYGRTGSYQTAPTSLQYATRQPMQASAPSPTASWGVATSPASRIEQGTAEDIFHKVQKAWSLRDLSSVRDVLGADLSLELEQDLNYLRQNRLINRLEHIHLRQVWVGEPWREGDADQNEVRFSAQLLDYTVDEFTGAVREGHPSEPVWFDETWIFRRASGQQHWQLVGIQQVT
jgi:predicted lipid-binding transport protein (Tim44 family)